MTLYTFDNSIPEIKETSFIAPNASLIGRVRIGEKSSVWFNTVLRGDMENISIGDESNIQDLSMGHADPGFPLIVGNRVTIGHHCVVHGCRIEDDCLIGMGAIIMNGVKIGRGSIIGAGAVLLEGMEVPEFSMVVGSPANVRKTYDESILENIRESAQIYVKRSISYREQNTVA
ncbi:MAG: gamma carbonic anhydrase family protein [SAR324 cluster bacterium]|nr:gamma carbonic anhydrase family protein [SAR324 cluster bacterium]MCS5553468.1 gamma carbonic anhydrase family protein [SAR324 cluster bacterium]